MASVTVKVCSSCKTQKTLDLFYKCKRSRFGVKGYCKECCQNRKEARKLADPVKHRENLKRNYLVNKDKRKSSTLKHFYGINIEQYKRMLSNQNNLCAICNNPENPGKSLAVDHCHKTGKVRGLLCSNCNRALGFFKDDWTRLANAISHIKEPNYSWKINLK